MSQPNRTVTHPVETETSLNTEMDMLVDISSRLSATEHFVDKVRADKAAEAAHRDQSPSSTWTTPQTSRGHGRRWQVPDEPQQVAPTAMADMFDAVRVKVGS